MAYRNTLVLCCLMVTAIQAAPVKQEGIVKPPVPPRSPAPVYGLAPGETQSDHDQRGQYSHGFNDKESGALFSEKGTLISTNGGWEYVIAKEGSYSYTSPEGRLITVRYVADHNGFRVLPEDAAYTY